MQTNFTLAQLADPAVAQSEKILRKCVHCGFCTATCPTYVTLGDELDSPRGRIYLIKDLLEHGRKADERFARHIDRCLSCLACMTTCPSGVDYMHLVDHARAHIEKTWRRPLADRFWRSLLANVLPFPWRFRLALAGASLLRPFAGAVSRLAFARPLAAMLALAPRRRLRASGGAGRGVHRAAGVRKARVALLAGCAQKVLDPTINEAAVELLNRIGVEVTVAKGEGCCGALVHHMGRESDAHAAAKRNIAAWSAEIEGEGLDAILITTSGCGTTLKDYGHMLARDRHWAERARKVSALVRDISEYLASLELPKSDAGRGLRVAYHAACSLQHGLKVKEPPRRLLADAGFSVLDVPEGHLCCGSAGTYNILQPEISAKLKARKLANIASLRPDLVAAGNIGCIAQLAPQAGVPVIHTVKLLNWAHGGGAPEGLPEPGGLSKSATRLAELREDGAI